MKVNEGIPAFVPKFWDLNRVDQQLLTSKGRRDH